MGFNKRLLKKENIKRAVKCAERSGVPIEILVKPQWFIKILDKKEQLKNTPVPAKGTGCVVFAIGILGIGVYLLTHGF
jgi:hypothetical protein